MFLVTEEEVCILGNMFSGIKSILFKIEILTVLLLCHSFGNVIHNIATNSNGLLSVSDIKNLGNCYKKRNKVWDINFLKNCKTVNVFPKFVQFGIPLLNIRDRTTFEKRFT